MIELKNKKIYDFIVKKDELVDEGRSISSELDKVEIKIKKCQDKEKAITAKVEPDKELKERGDVLVELINKNMKELEEISKQIRDQKLEKVPKALEEEHKELMKTREKLQRDINKVALKVQKIKDRLTPLIQKEVKPLLEEYDDIETAQAKNGVVIIKTFNYLEDFKAKFKR